MIQGDAGFGKTRLVTELAGRPEVSGYCWVTGSAHRIREPFPLGPVIEAIRGMGEHLATATYSPVVGALRPLLPELSHLLPPQPLPLEDRAAERHRLFRGMVEVLASLDPAVLVLEDVHWADPQTPEFIRYLLAEPPPSLGLVLTFRSGEGGMDVNASVAKLPASVSRTDITLGPLDVEQTGTLTATILGQRVSAEFIAYIWERTSGVPFAIEELLALLQARGALVRGPDGWVRRALDELNVPAGVRAQVLERVGVLSGPARAVVDAAAVLQSPTEARMLEAVCRAPDDQILRGLDEALQARVLVSGDGLVGFRHLLAARAVYEAIPPARRRALHGRAADVLEALDPTPLGKLAYHRRHAGLVAAWVDAAERAADQAVEHGHDAEAARLLEDLLREAPLDDERRGRVAVTLSRAAIETLQVGDDLVRLLTDVLDHDLAPKTRGELRFRLALLHEAAGADPHLVRQLYVDAVEDLDGRRDLQAWAMMGLGIHTAAGVPLSEHRRWVQRVLDVLPNAGTPAFQTFLLGKAAMVLVAIGDPGWRPLAARVEMQADEALRDRHIVNAYQSLGMAAGYVGHFDVAARLLTRALESPVTAENRKLEVRVRSALAYVDYSRGRWDGLGDTVAGLLDGLHDYPLARVDVEVVAGCLGLARGQLKAARRKLAEVARTAMDLGAYDLVASAVDALARSSTANENAEGAIEATRAFLAAVRAKGFWMPVARALPGITQLLVDTGHLAEATDLVWECARGLDGLDAPLAAATIPHAQGWLEAAAHRPADAAARFREAADRYDACGCPYLAAQAREQAAGSMIADGDAAAATSLTAAVRTYQRLGARWDRDRAARRARRHGMTVPALHRGGRRGYHGQLSPREREVADLAAAGRTNGEIAGELFLSPKTVEKHIGAALRKLGLRTRAALARQLDGGGQADGDLTKNGVISP
jgi:DNA-binding CsgD family transcriptional regulator